MKLLDEGLSLNEVARRIGCEASSVMRWRDRRARVAERVFEVSASPGRPPRLSLPQKRRLMSLLAKGPLAHGYVTDAWTCGRVRRLIRREFRVRYHRDHVGRLRHQLGLSPQKPAHRDEPDVGPTFRAPARPTAPRCFEPAADFRRTRTSRPNVCPQ